MCRKVSLLYIPPSAALWSLSINLGSKPPKNTGKKSFVTPALKENDILISTMVVGLTRNRTGVARIVQARLVKDEGSEPEVITATL
jgi:hypothetical protein